MSNKHKWYDVIVAWASGEKIQFNFAQSGWEDFTKVYITDIPGFIRWVGDAVEVEIEV